MCYRITISRINGSSEWYFYVYCHAETFEIAVEKAKLYIRKSDDKDTIEIHSIKLMGEWINANSTT